MVTTRYMSAMLLGALIPTLFYALHHVSFAYRETEPDFEYSNIHLCP